MDEKTSEAASPPSFWVGVSETGQWLQSREPLFSTVLFFVFALLLYLTVGWCEPCVIIILICSLFLCLQFRVMNLILWACIVVLWFHGYRFSVGNSLALTWK
jgi:hypothetical protein